MKVISNDFKNEIVKMGRQIDFKIELYLNDKLITQDNKFILTQDDMPLIVEQIDDNEVDYTITSENIYNAVLSNKGTILSTMMREFDFEIKDDLRVGDILSCSFGLLINESYEWVNFGKYFIYSKEFNEDTKTFEYVAYDSMLFTMIDMNDRTIIENVSVKTAIENIANKVGLNINITAQDETNYPNLSKTIAIDTFKDLEITYRDVLDSICQCLGLSIICDSKNMYLKPINRTVVDTINEEYLKDINVKFGKKYGPINSLVLSRSEDNDNIYRKDDESIAEYGLCEFKIKDNVIMLGDDREQYMDEIFNQIKGLEFYINDYQSIGITYLDWLDMYNVEIGDNTYNCLMLNDEIKIRQGLEESIYTEEPEETTTDYKTASKTDKEVSFIVDKQRGEIKSRVSQDELESVVEQTASSIGLTVSEFEDGEQIKGATILAQINADESIAQIKADKINLAGKSIYMTTDSIKIIADNFIVDEDGNLTCNNADVSGKITSSNATITGGSIELTGSNDDTVKFTIKKSGVSSYSEYSPLFYKVYSNNNLVATFGWTGVSLSSTISSYKSTYNSGGIGFTNNNSQMAYMNGDGIVGAYTYNNLSLEERKKNFEKFDKALDIIKNIDIYKYNYKTEEDETKKHIGLIIGDKYNYSKEITSKENDSVDLYSFVSVCCKAIQEQQEQIDDLKEEIKRLKEGDK